MQRAQQKREDKFVGYYAPYPDFCPTRVERPARMALPCAELSAASQEHAIVDPVLEPTQSDQPAVGTPQQQASGGDDVVEIPIERENIIDVVMDMVVKER